MTEAMLLKHTGLASGKLRRTIIQSLSSVNLSTSDSPQTEVDIPNYGDVVGFIIETTVSATGTLTGAKTLDYGLKNVNIKDKSGSPIWQNVRGIDLAVLSRLLNIGQNRTVPTTSGSNQTHKWFMPCNIEAKHLTSKIQVVLAPYSDLATSGATGATLSVTISALYMDKTNVEYTTRFHRVSQTIDSGLYRFGPNLPKNKVIQHLLFSVGTESNVTSLEFSADGNMELSDITPAQLGCLDDEFLVDGHVSGQLSLYNTPFVVTDKTVLDVTGAGSDTIQWFFVLAD